MTDLPPRILAATDLSARADRAVARAFQIAGSAGRPLTALLVLDDALPEEMLSSMYEKARHQLEALCQRSMTTKVDYDISVQIGDPTEELLRAAAEDVLLVLGPHRPRPFLDGLRETTMQRVVRRTTAPVLLVKGPVGDAYESVLSLVDYSPAATAALKLVAELAPDAEITAANAIFVPYSGMLETSGAVQMDMAAAFMKETETHDAEWRAAEDLPPRLASKTILTQAAPMGMIHDLTRDGRYDLITVGAHGRVGAARSVLGSVALDLMRDPPCDVLIARG